VILRSALRGHKGRAARRILRRPGDARQWNARGKLGAAYWADMAGYDLREDRRMAAHYGPSPAQLLHRAYRRRS
jgi:hypothetical protein